jgi:hypothetical protein
MPIPNNNSILSIKDFFDRHNGLQRSNRFTLSFSNLPASLPTISNNDLNPLAITIGARAIDGVADGLAGYGPGRTIPRSQKFPQGILLTFPVTNDNFITLFFNSWFNLIYSGGRQSPKASSTNNARNATRFPYQVQFYDDIIAQTQMKISLLDPNGNPNVSYNFFEVYPVECLPIELNMLKSNDYSTYTVLMLFRDFNFYQGI